MPVSRETGRVVVRRFLAGQGIRALWRTGLGLWIARLGDRCSDRWKTHRSPRVPPLLGCRRSRPAGVGTPPAGGQDTRDGSAQVTLTTSGCGSPAPSSRISGSEVPSRRTKDRALRISSASRAALHGHQSTFGHDQRHRPLEQATQWRHRPRGDHVEPATPCKASARPRTTSTVSSPRASTTSSRKVVRRSSGSTSVTRRSGRAIARTSPGKPGTRADVADGDACGDDLAQARAVQQMSLPQPGRLARSDQPPYDALSRQQGGVALRQPQPILRKRPPRRCRRGGRFT